LKEINSTSSDRKESQTHFRSLALSWYCWSDSHPDTLRCPSLPTSAPSFHRDL